MDDLWRRIESAFARLAPELLMQLPAGASADAIATAEERIGIALPDDVRATFARHDGSGEAELFLQNAYEMRPIGVALHSLEDMACDWERWHGYECGRADYDRDRPDGPIRRKWWNSSWVPFTWDGGGDHLCLDFDPAPGGTPGQVICFSHEIGPVNVVAENWRAFFAQCAADLESGRTGYVKRPEFPSLLLLEQLRDD